MAALDSVLTLVSGSDEMPLNRDIIKAVEISLDRLGVQLGELSWLAEGKACDILFGSGDPDQIEAALERALDGFPVDCFAQPIEGRRKNLLLADMDSTIIAEESLDELAGHLGLKDHIAAITARAMAGELDFEAAVRERVGLLKGLPETDIARTVSVMTINPGARELVATMKANGATCLLVSGGFEHFTGAVAEMLGFDGHFGNRLGILDGKMTGEVEGAIRDQHSKLTTLRETASSLRLSLDQTMTVGDGANDVPMLQAAGAGVAYHAKPVAQQAARFRVRHGDLTALLYLQGYRQQDFAA
jgi:phosphoserine phosphatase